MKKKSNRVIVHIFLIFGFIAFLCPGTYAASVSLYWDAPVENEDNTPLTDLDGFIIYYGSSSGNYTSTINVGNVISYQISNLNNGQTYYFTVKAYDYSGNESVYAQEVSVQIPSLPYPDIAVDDSISPAGDLQMPFGDVTGGASSQQTVTVTNAGNADLVIGSVAGDNPLSTPFSILNNYCSGQTISPSSSCTLTVRFAPSGTGAYNDSFNIPSNDPDENPVTISVSGSGVAMPQSDINVSDSVAPGGDRQIPFGDVTDGASSQQTVTVTNAGNADLVIGSVAGDNPLSTPFSILNNYCSGQTISPSSSCTLTVRFAPSGTGAYNDSFNIPSNDPDENPVTISVSGSGAAMPQSDINVSDSVAPGDDRQIPFGDVTDGASSQQTVTVTNTGNADLVIGSVAGDNPLSTPFSILNNYCSGQTISPSSSCTLTVRFAPSETGAYNDSFNIPSNDHDEELLSVNVNGTGTVPPVPDITVTDSVEPGSDLQMPFGDVTEGLSSEQTVTVRNDGSASLSIGNIAHDNPLSAPFTVLKDTCSGQTISPSSSCALTVSFAPSTTGTYNDSFGIPSSDPDENPVIISLSGSGLSSIVNNPPDEPTLVYPAHGQKGLGKKVGFKWKKSKDPDGDLVTYDLTVCQDQNMTEGCITETNLASVGRNDILYAGINTFNPLGFLVIVLIPFLFVTRNINRSRLLIAIIFSTAVLLISCGGGEIGSGGAVVTSESGSVPTDEVSQDLSGLNSATTYYWTVTAHDGNGGESVSEVRSFDTE